MHNAQNTARAHTAIGRQLILVELNLAITFCQVALATRHSVNASRNIENAKRALDATLRLRERVHLSGPEQQEVADNTARVQSLFRQVEDQAVLSR